jgi:hypothetical protein
MDTFDCYYCGLGKPGSESSDEHIVPSCIGGNRNVTLTDRVCGTCNSFMGDNVDRPFCRDWFIESARLIAGVAHRGKRPATFMGTLTWARPERVGVYLLEGGSHIWAIDGTDGKQRLAIGLDPTKPEMVAAMVKVIRDKFPGRPVVNDSSPHTDYELELANAVSTHGSSLSLTNNISLVAWHREVVKMALGLACQSLGDKYIASKGAGLLRAFLQEDDPAKRERIELHGHVGLGPEAAPSTTSFWHPGGSEHLLALIATGGKVAFVVNLFGRYENLVEVDDTGAFDSLLPGTAMKGVAWIVDPEAKTTQGPLPVETLFRRPGPPKA